MEWFLDCICVCGRSKKKEKEKEESNLQHSSSKGGEESALGQPNSLELSRRRKEAVEKAVDIIKDENFLREVLAVKGVPYVSMRGNPHLRRGHRPYDNFVNSFVSSAGENCYEKLQKLLSGGLDLQSLTELENERLSFVFHGTKSIAVDSILHTGLLPSFRERGNVDWFGADYITSLQYCFDASNRKLVFFLVLNGYRNSHPYFPSVTSENNEFQLPLAELSFAP